MKKTLLIITVMMAGNAMGEGYFYCCVSNKNKHNNCLAYPSKPSACPPAYPYAVT